MPVICLEKCFGNFLIDMLLWDMSGSQFMINFKLTEYLKDLRQS